MHNAEVGLLGIPLAKGADRFVTQNGEVIHSNIENDEWGFRRIKSSNSHRCIVLMGDSVTYGLGVNNDESMGSILQDFIGERARVVNLSLPGWGPHNILSLIQTGRANAPLRNCKETLGMVFLQPDHIDRVMGARVYSMNSPRYILASGELKRAGTHYSHEFKQIIQSASNISITLAYLSGFALWAASPGHEHGQKILNHIVESIAGHLKQQWNGTLTAVHVWGLGDNSNSNTGTGFIQHISMRSMVSELSAEENWLADRSHLSPKGHRAAAKGIIKMLVPKEWSITDTAKL